MLRSWLIKLISGVLESWPWIGVIPIHGRCLNAIAISQTLWIGIDPICGTRSCDCGNAADRDEPYPWQLSNEPKISPNG